MKLSEVQDILMQLYEVPCDFCVEDFLVTPEYYAALQATTPNVVRAQSRESLIIQRSGDEYFVGIYLSSDVLRAIERFDKSEFSTRDLTDLCAAIEGVSHFLYFMDRAARGFELSQMEMELQAEIDKFVFLTLYLKKYRDHPLHGRLLSELFDGYSLVAGLAPVQQERYHDANHMAARYCRWLKDKFLQPWLLGRDFLNELRKFYQLDHWSKLAYIRA